jgi:rhombotail lipoprotein
MMRFLILSLLCCYLTACNYNVQTTSGEEYLSKYPTPNDYNQNKPYQNIDAEVRQVAAIEPQLQFPARIGIAKIINGKLASMSHEEANLWFKAREQLGGQFGEFVPVSPLIAEMVTGQNPSSSQSSLYDVIRKIRLGAARQHLDVVLLYEVYGKFQHSSNLLSLMDLTIVGAYISPGQSLQADGYAKALLLDVRNGYPYGTAEGVATKEGLSTRVGRSARERALYENTVLMATEKLVESVQKMFFELKQKL